MDEQLRFESAIERLEAIVERIESGEVGLEAALEEYEKGIGLIGRCRSILDRAEAKITQLSASGDEDAANRSEMDTDF